MALAAFALALAAKSAVATAPVAFLAVLWWKRGRILRSEWIALAPFFVMGLAAGLVTGWIEKAHVGAEGEVWSAGLAEKIVIAGRALWFYAGKFVLPVNQSFIYPRWQIDALDPVAWLPTLAAVAVLVLLFAWSDGFKLINDSLGHEIGDMMLICIGERLRESLRVSDMVTQPNSVPSRVGGDEFLVLLEDLRETRDCVTVAERLLEVLGQPYEVDGHRLTVSMSIGISTCDQGYENASDAVRDADTAMYRSKAEGGSRYTLFDSAMHEDAKQRLSILGHLREAVRKNQIALHYQPIVRLGGGQLVRLRGARPLDAPAARPRGAATLHRSRRGDWADPQARTKRPSHGLPPASRLARGLPRRLRPASTSDVP